VKRAVPDAGSAGVFVVIADSDEGVGLWGVRGETDGVSVRELSTMDQTRRYGELRLDSTPAILLVPPGEASDVIHRTRLRAQAALAVEAVGLAQRALDLAKAHAAEREQFGKAIGSYQAVSHQVADTYMAVELARSLAYWAAWCVAESDPQAEVAAAAAKSFAAEAAVEACERSIQVHGGIGFTWEHILHRLYKRAQWIDGFDGFGRAHRETVATSLLGAPR
jgi:alkylation response protein AidB-like acyl-CoA dehydrogenase